MYTFPCLLFPAAELSAQERPSRVRQSADPHSGCCWASGAGLPVPAAAAGPAAASPCARSEPEQELLPMASAAAALRAAGGRPGPRYRAALLKGPAPRSASRRGQPRALRAPGALRRAGQRERSSAHLPSRGFRPWLRDSHCARTTVCGDEGFPLLLRSV